MEQRRLVRMEQGQAGTRLELRQTNAHISHLLHSLSNAKLVDPSYGAVKPGIQDRELAPARPRLAFQDLRKRVTENSTVARYLATVYREWPNASHLYDLQLERLQWLWNFAPFQVDCLYQARSDGANIKLPTFFASSSASAEVVCSTTAEAGAVRVAPSMGLRLFDVYGYGVPAPVHSGRCGGGGDVIQGQGDALFDARDGLIEVLRIGVTWFKRGADTTNRTTLTHEGGANGCWYMPMRGTGVFLETGETLYVANRSRLVNALRITKEMLVSAAMKAPKPRKLRGQFLLDMWSLGHAGKVYPRSIEDYLPFCPHVRAHGYATVVMGPPSSAAREIISCDDACMKQPLHGACQPGLRTGLRGNRACVCDDSQPIVNCAGKNGADVPPFPQLDLVGGERGPSLHLLAAQRRSRTGTPIALAHTKPVRMCELHPRRRFPIEGKT